MEPAGPLSLSAPEVLDSAKAKPRLATVERGLAVAKLVIAPVALDVCVSIVKNVYVTAKMDHLNMSESSLFF